MSVHRLLGRKPLYVALPPSLLPRATLEAYAERARRKLSADKQMDLSSIAEQLGGEIARKRHWDRRRGDDAVITIKAKNKFGVFVPALFSDEERQFLIAKAIGYYLVHYRLANLEHGGGVVYGVSLFETGPIEQEAKQFAMAFLMPRALFLQQYRRFMGSCVDVAKEFVLPLKVVRQRGEELGLFDAEEEIPEEAIA